MKVPEGCSEPSVDLSPSTAMEVEATATTSKSPDAANSAPSTSTAGAMDTLPEDVAMSMMPSAMNSVSRLLYVYDAFCNE